MRLSKYFLYNWMNVKLNITKVCEQITYSGLEVESIKNNVHHFNNIKIGKIINIIKHPYDVSLIILKIDIGIKHIFNIVSHKKKFKCNMKIVIATTGSVISHSKTIQEKYIKDILSEGILCSFKHLNMFDDNNDFIELPESAPIGLNFHDYIFYQDKLIKINITPNRFDALGMIGLAREISILNNLPIPQIGNIYIPINTNIKCNININISNIIYSYSGRIIQNINLKKNTPIWMKEKLRRCHIHSKNIVVDIINYVFMEFGHSIYTFSFLKIMYDIFIRFTKNIENISLNQKDIVLNDKIIVISNKSKILSFLGNINFDLFPIDLNNRNLFIGSFFIDPELVYNSIYQIKKNNFLIKNNEYYVDPYDQKNIIEYTTNLFLKICGGYAGPITSHYSHQYNHYINRKIYLFYNNILKITGCNIHYNIINKFLKQLQYLIFFKNKNMWCIIPPKWRLDILIEEDVISDIMRIYQYNNILLQPLHNSQCMIEDNMIQYSLKRIKYLLIDLGYHEVINYSFVDPKIQNLICDNNNFLSLINPISNDMSCMRYSLLPGLIKNVCYHQNRQYDEIQFFESGLCFLPHQKEKLGVKQSLYLSGVIGNNKYKYHWDIPIKLFDFYDIKGHIESIFDILGYLKHITFKREMISSLHPQQSVGIFLYNKLIGYFGALHPNLLQVLHLKYSIFLFELYWDKLFFKDKINIKNVSEYPCSIRDISILLDQNIDVHDIVLFCKKNSVNVLLDIRVFDIYVGPTIPNSKKSVSLKFIFQSMYKTLQENEIDDLICYFLKILKHRFNVSLREA